MWRDALAAHDAGRIRTFEVRGSDYLGGKNILSVIIAPALRTGRTAFVPADLDAPHTWTNIEDVAKLLVVGAADERAWGKAWHVPSAPPCSVRELTGIAARQLAVRPKVRSLPASVLWSVGVFNREVRELRETQHQFRQPFILDSCAAETTFGLQPASLEESVGLALAGA
jgi:nucleoside-diphosphate-sugar epimerase